MRTVHASPRVIPAASTVLLIALVLTITAAVARRQADPMPFGLTFDPSDAANLEFKGVVGEQCSRSYTITNTSNQRVRVFTLRVGASDEFLKWSDRRGVWLNPGDSHIVTVTFAPKQAGSRTTARLTFSAGNRNQTRQVTVRFPGIEGESCKPPAAPDEEGGGVGGGGEPGTGVLDPGFSDFGAVPQDEQRHTICVRIHIVTKGWGEAGGGGGQRPTPEQLRECVRIVSGWYSGVDFTVRPADGPPGEVDSPEDQGPEDPHCINVFIVHDQWFEKNREDGDTEEETRRKAGHAETRPLRGKAWTGEGGVLDDLGKAGVDRGYLRGMGAGTRITIEAGDHFCSTLAHELGHTLGLGQGPGKAHHQPDDNTAIDDADRLLDRNGNGSKLSDGEQTVAKRVAQYMRETMLLPCDSTGSSREDDSGTAPPQPPRNDFRRAGIFNEGESVRFEARTWHAFDVRETSPDLVIELDGDDDGAADVALRYTFRDGEWQIASEPAIPDSIGVLEPGLIAPLHTDRLGTVRGVAIELPKDALPGEESVIGWRMTLALPQLDVRRTIPAAAFDRFDITTPALAITLDDARTLRAAPGGTLALAGSLYTSRTFTGDVALSVTLAPAADPAARRVHLPITTLAMPLPERWSGDVELPDTLPAGRYDVTVYAACDECRLETSLAGVVRLGGGGSPLGFLAPVALLLLGIVVIALLLARRRGERAEAA